MTPKHFLEIIKRGLPHCEVLQFVPANLVCRVKYGGRLYDISGGQIDGFPIFVVTTPEQWMDETTNAVLERLDSIAEEVTTEPRPWQDTAELLRRLRELAEEGEDDDPA
jgi:hypothetical protein